MKKLKNKDVTLLATRVNIDFTYFSKSLRYVRNFDVQKNIRDNEPLLIAENGKLEKSIESLYGIDWRMTKDAKIVKEINDIFDRDSDLQLKKIKLTDDQIRSFSPDWDAYNCIDFIRM